MRDVAKNALCAYLGASPVYSEVCPPEIRELIPVFSSTEYCANEVPLSSTSAFLDDVSISIVPFVGVQITDMQLNYTTPLWEYLITAGYNLAPEDPMNNLGLGFQLLLAFPFDYHFDIVLKTGCVWYSEGKLVDSNSQQGRTMMVPLVFSIAWKASRADVTGYLKEGISIGAGIGLTGYSSEYRAVYYATSQGRYDLPLVIMSSSLGFCPLIEVYLSDAIRVGRHWFVKGHVGLSYAFGTKQEGSVYYTGLTDNYQVDHSYQVVPRMTLSIGIGLTYEF